MFFDGADFNLKFVKENDTHVWVRPEHVTVGDGESFWLNIYDLRFAGDSYIIEIRPRTYKVPKYLMNQVHLTKALPAIMSVILNDIDDFIEEKIEEYLDDDTRFP
jgi:hypothetical protein